MAVLLKSGAVFIHIPKTGGSWVKKVLYEQDLVKFEFAHEHADLERIENVSGHYVGNYIKKSLILRQSLDTVTKKAYKFCFVRNPFDWYESFWRFMMDRSWQPFIRTKNLSWLGLKCDLWHPVESIERLGDNDFNGFIEKVVHEVPGYLTQLYHSYAPNNKAVNFIGKQENLMEDLIAALRAGNIKFDEEKIRSMQKINESKKDRPKWDKKLKEQIYQLEYPVFFKYGYGMEGYD